MKLLQQAPHSPFPPPTPHCPLQLPFALLYPSMDTINRAMSEGEVWYIIDNISGSIWSSYNFYKISSKLFHRSVPPHFNSSYYKYSATYKHSEVLYSF